MNALQLLEMKIERQCEEDGCFYETYFHVNPDGNSFYTPLEMLETLYTIYTKPNHVPSPLDKIYVPEKHLLELMIQARRLQPFPKKIIKKSKKNSKKKIPYKSNHDTIQKVKKNVPEIKKVKIENTNNYLETTDSIDKLHI